MTDHIAFDLTRLFIGPIAPTPRGIDRVDLGYARHFFEHWNGDCVGILPTPWPRGVSCSKIGTGRPAKGGVIGIAQIVDCVKKYPSRWFTGQYGFLLRNRRLL
jgi:hypothetical protein